MQCDLRNYSLIYNDNLGRIWGDRAEEKYKNYQWPGCEWGTTIQMTAMIPL
jgi:hypothetical protein